VERSLNENQYHHGDLKQSALNIASKLVHNDGASALTLRNLASTAEVSHAALYRHFKDRHALLDEVAAQWLRELVRKLAKAESVGDALRVYVATAVASKELYRLAFSMMASPEASQTRIAISALRDTAAVIFASGEKSQNDVRDRVLRVWATMHGMLDLYWNGLIRARSQRAATDYIVKAAQR
jgi:AcrR family transcriptional regulator